MLIQKISSILKTWVFKNKVLKFSDRHPRDPMACFYCPELCRFSCPIAETLRDDTVTPRGKMSLLHMANMGTSPDAITGDSDHWLWTLSQCTGCGRCTEYCLYEIDVAKNLREARQAIHEKKVLAEHSTDKAPGVETRFEMKPVNGGAAGAVLLAHADREQWWRDKVNLQESRSLNMAALEVSRVIALALPSREWSRGRITKDALANAARSLASTIKGHKRVWVENPEDTWFLVQLQKEHPALLKGFEFRPLWQALFRDFSAAFLAAKDGLNTRSLHESYFLSRLLPREGVSNPEFEKGLSPVHRSWNVIDCGGEGHYVEDFPKNAAQMRSRLLHDLGKTGQAPTQVICQSLACARHLSEGDCETVYWLDFLVAGDAK